MLEVKVVSLGYLLLLVCIFMLGFDCQIQSVRSIIVKVLLSSELNLH